MKTQPPKNTTIKHVQFSAFRRTDQIIDLSRTELWLVVAHLGTLRRCAECSKHLRLPLALENNLAISIAEIQVNRCLTFARVGRFGEVEEMLKEARAIAAAVGELVTVARIDMNLGDLYTSLGRPAEALRCFYLAEAGFVAMEQGSVQARQANTLRQLGALPAALRRSELALRSVNWWTTNRLC